MPHNSIMISTKIFRYNYYEMSYQAIKELFLDVRNFMNILSISPRFDLFFSNFKNRIRIDIFFAPFI